MPGPVEDWQPSEADLRELTPRGRDWLHATLAVYRLNGLEGLRVMEACRVLSRVEVLESEPGMTTAAALARERRLFVSMWDALRLEK